MKAALCILSRGRSNLIYKTANSWSNCGIKDTYLFIDEDEVDSYYEALKGFQSPQIIVLDKHLKGLPSIKRFVSEFVLDQGYDICVHADDDIRLGNNVNLLADLAYSNKKLGAVGTFMPIFKHYFKIDNDSGPVIARGGAGLFCYAYRPSLWLDLDVLDTTLLRGSMIWCKLRLLENGYPWVIQSDVSCIWIAKFQGPGGAETMIRAKDGFDIAIKVLQERWGKKFFSRTQSGSVKTQWKKLCSYFLDNDAYYLNE